LNACPLCRSTRLSHDDDRMVCEGCGKEFPLEDELRDVREELYSVKAELNFKEEGGTQRIVDEDRFLIDCLRLENRIEKLEEEEQRIIALLGAE
jgi:uncharacterized protein YbaR (Trm112 family)